MSNLEPDLRAADAWLATRSATERKRTGQWVTPWWVCAATVELLAPDIGPKPRVLDPACGDGRWLLAAAHRFPGARLLGWDVDPAAVAAARTTLSRAGVEAEIHLGDALAPNALPQVDLVVGNPPYVRPQHLDRAVARDLWARFEVATDKSDLYACFVQRALDRAPRIAMVIPAPFLSLTSFAALRRRILSGGLDAIFTLPADAFAATVRTVVLVCGPEDRRRGGDLGPHGLTPGPDVHVGPATFGLQGAPPELPGAPLGDRITVNMGVVCGDYARYVHAGRIHPNDRPTCKGRHVQRWHIEPTDLHIRYDPRDMLDRKPYVAPKNAALFDVPHKVVLAGTTGATLRAAMDTEQRFVLDSCYVIHPRDAQADPYGVLGLLLSTSVGAWYGARFRAARVKGVEIAQIPSPDGGWAKIAAAARAGDQAGLDHAVDAAYALTG